MLLKGGYWQDAADAGFFACNTSIFRREMRLSPYYKRDMEGLPDRWVKIINGDTSRMSLMFKL